jgi:hypothetical protein
VEPLTSNQLAEEQMGSLGSSADRLESESGGQELEQVRGEQCILVQQWYRTMFVFSFKLSKLCRF